MPLTKKFSIILLIDVLLTVFYNIVDFVSYNAYILYQIRPPQAAKKSNRRERFIFLLEMSEKLIKPLMHQQAERPIGLQQKTKIYIQCFDIDISVAQEAVRRQPRDEPPKEKRCYVCPRKTDIKIKQVCDLCKNIRSYNVCKK